MRCARGLAVALALLIGLWALPSLLARPLLASLGREMGLELELEHVRPAFPIGLRAEQLIARHPRWTLELRDARLRWLLTHFRAEACLEGGTLQARGTGMGASGSVQIEAVPLGEIPVRALTGFDISGRADGLLEWGPGLQGSLWISNGELRDPLPAGFVLPFSMLVLEAQEGADGIWKLSTLQLYSQTVELDGGGTLGPHGELALALTLRSLDASTRSLLQLLGIRIDRVPHALSIGGTLHSPRLR